MPRMRNARPLLAAFVLAGCSTSSGLAPIEARSGYDGARVVSIAPHGGACSGMLCPGVGAQWTSKAPAVAVVTVRVSNAWMSITGARLMVDGREAVLQPLPGVTTFSRPGDAIRESSRDFQVPLATLRSVVTAQKAWLRVSTTEGSMETAIVDGATDSKALHAMRRFLAQVDGLLLR